MSKLPGRNESKRIGGLEIEKFWKPSLQVGDKGSIGKRKLTEIRLFYSSGVIAAAWQQGHTKRLEKPCLSQEERLGAGNLYNQ